MDYPVVIIPLSEEEGGGFLGYVPDLRGCMSDGETPDEALANVREAIGEWLEESARIGRDAPEPGSAATRAAEEYKAIVEAYRSFSDRYDEIDRRLEGLSKLVEDIQEQSDHHAAWVRFTAITGLNVVENDSEVEGRC